MKFAAWRKVLSIFLLAVFLCAVPSLLTACSRSPASGSTELLDSTQLYFIELGRLVPGFEQPMLDSFREAAEKLDRLRPESIGRASRISGVSPADISVLLVWLGGSGRNENDEA